jgi:branched-chain amino acid transport system permease protein
MLVIDLALAGLGTGAIAALAAVGLITSYRATGVLNLSFGAVAMATAYLLWQQVRVWGWPVLPSALLDVFVVAPAFGFLLDRFVFRRLSDTTQKLMASLGVFVLLVGAAVLVWGTESRLDPPSVLPGGSVDLPGGARLPLDSALELGVALAVAALVGVVLRFTLLGVRLRATVDNRELAGLFGVRTDRLSALGWAFGSSVAGLSGVLLAPHLRLDPYGLPLLVFEIFGVAVVARLASLPVAVLAALAVGVGQAELSRADLTGHAGQVVQAVQSNLFVVVMLLGLLLLPRLREVPGRTTTPRRLKSQVPEGWWLPFPPLFLAPFFLRPVDLRTAQQVPALAIILLSLVLLTGFAGQLSLGQAGFAGLGALVSATYPGFGGLLAGVLLAAAVGWLTGWTAVRRHGLALALTTFAVAVTLSRFVFAQPLFTSGLRLDHPWPFSGERAFYFFELLCLAVTLSTVWFVRSGHSGRLLAAMRDSENGAGAVGVDVPRLKVSVFALSAALAALGGSLLGMSGRSFDATAFDPLYGLVWFAAVVVVGVRSVPGVLLAAGLMVGLDTVGTPGLSIAVVGVGAVLAARLPEGVLTLVRLPEPVPRRVRLTAPGLAARGRIRRL